MSGTINFDVVRTAAKMTRSVLVGISGGKDSMVTLDLCCRHFGHVEVFFMYYVKGLSFQESVLQWAERRYGIQILRIPHFELAQLFRYGSFCYADFDVPIISITDVYNYVREQTGIWYIAGGERLADSIWRNAIIKKSGTIDRQRGRIYPLAHWKKAEVLRYIGLKKLKASPEYSFLNHSFGFLTRNDIVKIKEHYPQDFELIKKWFPLIEANVRHHEITELRNAVNQAESD